MTSKRIAINKSSKSGKRPGSRSNKPSSPLTNVTTLQLYFQTITHAIQSENGPKISSLLDYTSNHCSTLYPELLQSRYLEGVVKSKLNGELKVWADVVLAHFKVVLALLNGNGDVEEEEGYIEAATEQNTLVQSFLRIFTTHTKWSLPILFVINRQLRDISILANTALVSRGKKAVKLEEAARTINKSFTYCITDRAALDVSRKWGVYYIMSLLFRVYYLLHTRNLCKNLLKALNAGDLPDLSLYPMSHQVTFRYYRGVMSFWDESYRQAEEDFTFALEHCHQGSLTNRFLILKYLVPIRLLSGSLPNKALLSRYPRLMNLYMDFITAIRTGNVGLFDKALQHRERELIQSGTYLVIEMARWVCFRTLFRKVWLLQDKTTRIAFSSCQVALKVAQVGQVANGNHAGDGKKRKLDDNTSVEEVECLLANLIDRGMVKGYLSHEKATMVLSNKDPFPAFQMS